MIGVALVLFLSFAFLLGQALKISKIFSAKLKFSGACETGSPPIRRLKSMALHMDLPKKKKTASLLPNLQQSAFPEPEDMYDLVVIGAGPGGESAAVHAAQLGAKVAIIERKAAFGGPSGLTSKAVREAAKRIVKAVDQIGGSKKRQIAGLWRRKFPSLRTEAEVMQAKETRDRLTRNGVDLFVGTSTFVDTKGTSGLNIYDEDDQVEAHDVNEESSDVTVRVCRPGVCVDLYAKHAIVATGSRPHRPKKMAQRFAQKEENKEVVIPFKKGVVVDATEMGALNDLPTQAAAVIGGGVIAVEYATILAELGVGVSVICAEESFMSFLDDELRYRLKRAMKKGHVLFVTEAITDISVEEKDDGSSPIARIRLEPRILPARQVDGPDGKQVKPSRKLPERKLTVDMILYSGGRNANSDGLGLDAVGVDTGRYGRIVTDPGTFYTTAKANNGYSIFAIGDVAGGGLASTAMQQARTLTEALFGTGGGLFGEDLDEPGAGFTGAQKDGNEDEEEDEYDLDTAIDDFFIEPSPSGPRAGVSAMGGASAGDGREGTLFGDATGGSTIDAPLTLWTVPEIASVGYTVEQAQVKAPSECCRASIVTGYAYFRDTARGRLTGGEESFLKIVAWKKKEDVCHTLVGVHIMGEGANELIQTGSIMIHAHVPLQQVSKTPFAAVTLSGLYQVACDDALMKLTTIRDKKAD